MVQSGLGLGGNDGESPSFMLSYARPSSRRTDENMRPIGNLFLDLVGLIGHISADRHAMAAFDQQMPIGTEWKKRLARYLARSRVLVPLVSPPFFESEWCGKEWAVFTRRKVTVFEPLHAEEQPIVPIIWVPVASQKMHPVVRNLQYNNLELPSSYGTEGLLALSLRGRETGSSDYWVVVNHIASRISRLMEFTRVETGRVVDLDSAPNAFKDARGQPSWDQIKFWHEDEVRGHHAS